MTTKQSNPDPLFQHFQELGRETPSELMLGKIMDDVRTPVPKIVYEPIISPRAMRFLLGAMVAMLLGIILFTPGNEGSYYDTLAKFTLTQMNFEIPKLDLKTLPSTLNISIIVFGMLSLMMLLVQQWQWKKWA